MPHRSAAIALLHLAKAILVGYLIGLLAWRVRHGALHHPVRVCFHHFLARARLTRHCLPAAAPILHPTRASLSATPRALNRRTHAILLHTAEHVPRIVKIVSCESQTIEVALVWHSSGATGATLAYVRISAGGRVSRIGLLLGLLLILQVSLHELTDGGRVAPRVMLVGVVVMVSGGVSAPADAQHGGALRLRVALSHAFAILNIIAVCRCCCDAAATTLETHLL